jgi:hypothetical protein
MLENNIKVDLKEVGMEVVEWIHVAAERHKWFVFVNVVMNIRVSYNFENVLVAQKTLHFYDLYCMD